jgi:hypothetical protein
MDGVACRESTADFEVTTTLLESVGCEYLIRVELSGSRLRRCDSWNFHLWCFGGGGCWNIAARCNYGSLERDCNLASYSGCPGLQGQRPYMFSVLSSVVLQQSFKAVNLALSLSPSISLSPTKSRRVLDRGLTHPSLVGYSFRPQLKNGE